MSTSSQSGGIGFFGVLTIVFIVLKLTNNINWAWLWVLAPIWLPFTMILTIFIVFLILKAIFD